MSVSRVLAVFTLAVCSVCYAHQDRIVQIRGDGSLTAIPAEFGPSALHVTFSPTSAGGPPVSSIELALGKQKTRLPTCVTAVINTVRIDDIKASASWYHDETALPYYLNVEFLDPGYNAKASSNPGYSLLFNLRTSRLMEMKVLIVLDQGKRHRVLPLDIAAMCSPSELQKFKAK